MGPEYYNTGVAGLPNITNKGLIRYQPPENDHIKDMSQCQRLYEEALKILKSKPVVKDGPKIGNAGSTS